MLYRILYWESKSTSITGTVEYCRHNQLSTIEIKISTGETLNPQSVESPI